MRRDQIINTIIKKRKLSSYLEIGLWRGQNFQRVNANRKVSVDPSKEHVTPTHLMTSDEFFEQNNETFDIVFIDGLHIAEQVYRDIKNSMVVLNSGGVIVCHDMKPEEEIQQTVPKIQKEHAPWTGDCWKALVRFRTDNFPYSVCVVDTDWGVGLIEESEDFDSLIVEEELNYENFKKNQKEWLNLISVDEFRSQYA